MPTVPESAQKLAGGLLVVGFEGTALPKSVEGALKAGERAGIIVFKRNIPDQETTRELPRAALETRPHGLTPLVSIDQEGGRVVRLPSGFKALPAMRFLGRAPLQVIETAARAVAQDLSRLGYNLDFAPVLDVDSNPKNPVIGDRSFSSDPQTVAVAGCAFARGLNLGGVLACGKHFPGHGDTDTDSHLTLPRLKHPRARLDLIELPPFAEAARRKMDSLMTAHVVVESLDPNLPATLSTAIVTDLLRRELRYEGVVFSDDLEMRAVADLLTVEQSSVGAILAGCDALLICRSEELSDRAHLTLTREIEKSPAFRARAEEAFARMHQLRTRAATLRTEAMPFDPDLWDDVDRDLEALHEVLEG